MYGSPEDIQKILPDKEILQLCDDTEASDVSDDAVQTILNGALEHVSGMMYAFIGQAVSTPLLVSIAATLAVEILYGRRPASALPDSWKARIASAKEMLELLAEKRLNIGSGAIPDPTIVISSPTQQFTEEVWGKF